MDSIICLDHQGKMVIIPEVVNLLPEFSLLEEPQVKYLVLAYDSMNTLFKQQSRAEWRNLAAKHVYGLHIHTDIVEKEIPINAIEKFKELVWDVDREHKQKLQEKLRKVIDDSITTDNVKDMSNLMAMKGMLVKLISEIDERISMSDEIVRLASKNAKLSYIEKWQLRRTRDR